MTREALLERVKRTVREIEADAEIILYGSRSRGDAREYSDWDFLILVDGPVDMKRTDAIRHRLYDVELDSGEVLCSIVRSREDWSGPLLRITPFHQNVQREGIVL